MDPIRRIGLLVPEVHTTHPYDNVCVAQQRFQRYISGERWDRLIYCVQIIYNYRYRGNLNFVSPPQTLPRDNTRFFIYTFMDILREFFYICHSNSSTQILLSHTIYIAPSQFVYALSSHQIHLVWNFRI